MNPRIIIVDDTNGGGGWILAQFVEERENPDGKKIPIYKMREYWHELKSALEET